MTDDIDPRTVRDALRADLGEAGWRRFLDDANGRRRDMTHLFHWQREAWERTRQRLGIAPLTHDELMALLRVCPVHPSSALERGRAPVVVRRLPTREESALAEVAFPYANSISPGLGLAGEEREREVWRCGACRDAETAWQAAHPPEPIPVPTGPSCPQCGGADRFLPQIAAMSGRMTCPACGRERWLHATPALDPAAFPRNARYAVIHRSDGATPPLAAWIRLKRFGATWTAPSYFDAAAFESAFRGGLPEWPLGTTWDDTIDELAHAASELGLRIEFRLLDKRG